MIVAYIIFAFIVGNSIFKIIKAIRKKKYTDLLSLLFMIPFFVFLISAIMLGGDALFDDPAKNYPLYQQGHYYLVNHGKYTEVSHSTFAYMQIIEIVGLISFGIGFILSAISDRRNKSNDN